MTGELIFAATCLFYHSITQDSTFPLKICAQKGGFHWIKYEREKRFASCKNKRTLPFDFYVENKYLIEFDGIQHYSNESKFYTENVKHNDKIKDTWCKKHHIPLIRIPYTHFDNLKLEDLLLDTSQFIVT